MNELRQALKGRIPAHVGLTTRMYKWRGEHWVGFYLRDYMRDENVYLGREIPCKAAATTAELLGAMSEWRASR